MADYSSLRRRVRILEEETGAVGRPDSEGDPDEETELREHPGDRLGDAACVDDFYQRRKRKKRSELEQIHWKMVNERVVDDITLEVFYKPHTISVLLLLCAYLIYKALQNAEKQSESNIFFGCMGSLALFLMVSAMAFPNGPFIRPHPVLWRIIFGLSVAYALLLQFTLYQSFTDVKKVLSWLDPDGLSKDKLVEKEYAVNCSDLTLERLWNNMDIFAVGHFLGWSMKAVLVRHGVICWYISCAWELTEVVFTHVLPNFQECWWDAILLDIILCNGLGILAGLQLCKFLEMRQFHWESIKSIQTTRGKVKRAVLQFTPESWVRLEWLSEGALVKRTAALVIFVLFFLATELNTFFIKHIFAIDTAHPVVFWRIILVGLISAPSIKQFYVYATDPLVKRLGMQCWMYCAVTALEAAICVKFGRDNLPAVQLAYVAAWILVLVVGTFASVWLSVWWATNTSGTRTEQVDGKTRHFYIDSSYENLGAIHGDVEKRRKRLGMPLSESDRD